MFASHACTSKKGSQCTSNLADEGGFLPQDRSRLIACKIAPPTISSAAVFLQTPFVAHLQRSNHNMWATSQLTHVLSKSGNRTCPTLQNVITKSSRSTFRTSPDAFCRSCNEASKVVNFLRLPRLLLFCQNTLHTVISNSV